MQVVHRFPSIQMNESFPTFKDLVETDRHTVQGGSSVTEENIDYSGNTVKSHSTRHWEMALQFLAFFFFFSEAYSACACANSLQFCLALCSTMDCSPLGSSILGILQAIILEWVALPSSRGSSWLRDQTCVSDVSCIGRWVLYHYSHLGSPI